MISKDTVKALALGASLLALVVIVTTPACIWIAGSVSSCEQMFCEILIMRRPHDDASTCQAWFDLFRE